jgi:hypothetical protein
MSDHSLSQMTLRLVPLRAEIPNILLSAVFQSQALLPLYRGSDTIFKGVSAIEVKRSVSSFL